MVRLPVEYQEVEYLESTGTQYFLTDIDIQDGLTVDSVQTISQSNDSYLFGGQGDSSTNSKTCFNGNYKTSIQGAYPKGYYLIGTVKADNQTIYHVVSTHANNRIICIVNDTVILNDSATNFVATTGKCLCFGYNKYGTPSNFYKGKAYSITISKTDVVLANFIPCYRKSDNEPGMYDTVTKQFFTNAGTGEFIVGNDVSYDTASLIERRRQILLNTPHLETISDTIASFKTDVPALVKDCKVYFSPVQEGTGDPSPDNVRPITGWDGVTVYKTNRNLLTAPDNDGYYPVFLPKGTIVCASDYTDSAGAGQVKYYRKDKTQIDYWTINTQSSYENRMFRSFSLIEDAYYFTFSGRYLMPQLEFGRSPTAYEPYTGTSITIPFPQTIYGGYVDLVKGELVQEWGIVDLGTLTWNYNSSRKMFQTNFVSATASPRKVICDHYKTVDSDYDKVDKTISLVQWIYPNGQINISDYSFDGDATAFKTAMNGVMASYKMRTPIAYQLTPETIKTLKGVNNIWSNANGNVEVKFWKH